LILGAFRLFGIGFRTAGIVDDGNAIFCRTGGPEAFDEAQTGLIQAADVIPLGIGGKILELLIIAIDFLRHGLKRTPFVLLEEREDRVLQQGKLLCREMRSERIEEGVDGREVGGKMCHTFLRE